MYGKYIWNVWKLRMTIDKEVNMSEEGLVDQLAGTKFDSCKHIDKLVKTEIVWMDHYMKRHPELKDNQEARMILAERVGDVYREFYCGYLCEDRAYCKIAEQYLLV